ncbi:ribosome-associated heat shock protein Hsp15 [Reinekea marinisedimentorum]|uniref:Heat shock protein 15 n=1 Tax=Reinekea marinisedimentorum TaxID=230495 RepID=A0A4R3IBJ0_9GAMM|nr:ribosome-associated heat shock protein Hsp15 [Reinekea marinisedimentorum]TCS43990.1 ribosome-associated heat shock protein Hsp15 [Reinekea marinisedimentorum]
MTETTESIRLDKWLWAARFFKTRALAKAAVEGGKVHYNRAKAKPSRTVEAGAELRMQLGWDEKTVIVQAVSDKRRGAPEAQLMYSETEASIEKRAKNAEARKAMNLSSVHTDHRPNKKQRRDIIRFKNINQQDQD